MDDDTSFRNVRRESVTLADLKVGDFVRGQGAMKDGVFVPRVLNAGKSLRTRQGTLYPPNVAPRNQAAADSGNEKK